MNRLRPVVALFLALTLVLTSGAMALARGQVAVAGTVVICTGQGVATVPVDSRGRPVGPAYICPDCALSLIATQAMPPLDLIRPLGTTLFLVPQVELPVLAGRPFIPYCARAPPVRM